MTTPKTADGMSEGMQFPDEKERLRRELIAIRIDLGESNALRDEAKFAYHQEIRSHERTNKKLSALQTENRSLREALEFLRETLEPIKFMAPGLSKLKYEILPKLLAASPAPKGGLTEASERKRQDDILFGGKTAPTGEGKADDLSYLFMKQIPAHAERAEQPAVSREGGWQPIETFDKDVSQFVLVHEDGAMRAFFWDHINKQWEHPDRIGHVVRDDDMCAHLTHWMPLPPAPQAAEGRGE